MLTTVSAMQNRYNGKRIDQSRVFATICRRGFQRGFTLIEILVSMVVLSIGMLGIARMQIGGLKEGKGSLQSTQATAFAYALADKMRANKTAASSYATTAPTTFTTSPPTDCSSTSCADTELAAYDTYNWFNDSTYGVKAVLGPGAQAWVVCANGTTTCTATNGSNPVYYIGVFWDRTRGQQSTATATAPCMSTGGSTGKYNPADPTQLACVVISVQL